MKNKYRINKIFINILISYLIVLLLPTIFLGAVYNIAENSIRNNIVQSNQAMLRQAMEAIEDKFYFMSRLIMTISCQHKLNDYLMANNLDISLISKSIKLRKEILSIQSTSDIIDKIYVYSNQSKMVLGESGIMSLEEFATKHYQNTSVNYDRLFKLISSSHMGRFEALDRIAQADGVKDQITFIQTLPVALNKQFDGTIIVLLNSDFIMQMLANIDLFKSGSVCIVDDYGNKLVEIIKTGKEKQSYSVAYGSELVGDYESEDMVVTKVLSPRTKWIYMVALPEKNVFDALIRVRMIAVTLIGIMLLIGLSLIVYLASYNTRPFTKISEIMYGIFGEELTNQNPYTGVIGAISKLVSMNRELHNTLNEHQDLLTYSFFNRLLTGGFASKNDVYAFLRRLNMNLDGDGYMVIHIRFFFEDERSGMKMVNEFNKAYSIVEKTATDLLYGKIYFHRQDIDNVILIFIPYYNQQNERILPELIKNNVEIFYNQLLINMEVCFHMAVGGYYKNIRDIAMSAKEAQQGLSSYGFIKDQSMVVWYDDRQNRDGSFNTYSLVFEQHLLNQIYIGNHNQVRELLDSFYINNIIKKRMSYKALNMLKYRLFGTLIRVTQELGFDENDSDIFDGINFDDPIDIFYNSFSEKVLKLCSTSGNADTGEKYHLSDKIIEYIQSQMDDPGFSMNDACERFNISRYYLNKFIQEKTGKNFSSYLEYLRMETALKLLNETDLPIHIIAEKVGYLNDKTFRRAFKRNFGFPPGNLRIKYRMPAEENS